MTDQLAPQKRRYLAFKNREYQQWTTTQKWPAVSDKYYNYISIYNSQNEQLKMIEMKNGQTLR
jgi:hypothetical protein